jgi:hypothetical protein
MSESEFVSNNLLFEIGERKRKTCVLFPVFEIVFCFVSGFSCSVLQGRRDSLAKRKSKVGIQK